MSEKETALTTPMSQEVFEQLRQSYPVEENFSRILLPRIGLRSQDIMKGKGKSMEVIAEAGKLPTFADDIVVI